MNVFVRYNQVVIVELERVRYCGEPQCEEIITLVDPFPVV